MNWGCRGGWEEAKSLKEPEDPVKELCIHYISAFMCVCKAWHTKDDFFPPPPHIHLFQFKDKQIKNISRRKSVQQVS